jgi:signal transduction histidine kinase
MPSQPTLAERSPKQSNRATTEISVNPDSLSDFSQVISHRIGSLLSGIEGYTDLILSSLESTEDRENAFRILESVSRVGGVLQDVRHYQESLILEKEPIEVRDCVSGILHLLADSEADRLSFESNLPPVLSAEIDSSRIKQAVLSVLRNAFEATASSNLPVSLFVDVDSASSSLRFKVFSPIPMAEKRVRAQLFNPFFTTKAANLGLGLTMARRIFRAHGGDVTLTSNPMDPGTEFTCTLPVLES